MKPETTDSSRPPHDRYFLDRVVDRIVELDEGALTEYIGGYSDCQAAKAREA